MQPASLVPSFFVPKQLGIDYMYGRFIGMAEWVHLLGVKAFCLKYSPVRQPARPVALYQLLIPSIVVLHYYFQKTYFLSLLFLLFFSFVILLEFGFAVIIFFSSPKCRKNCFR